MISRINTTFVFAIAILFFYTSCKEERIHGKGEVTTEQYELSGFDKIVLETSIDANITVGEGEAYSVSVKAHENIHEYVKAEVKGNELRVYKKIGAFFNDDIDVAITLPVLTKLEIDGAAEADIDGVVSGDDFLLDVQGAADVSLKELNVNNLNVALSGASELDIKGGTVNRATYKVTGAGEIYADGLKATYTKARVSGASEMSLYVTDTLEADITGAGEIDYKGHPHIASKVTGAGALNNKN